MRFHVIGNRRSSQPSTPRGEGVSLAVRQWMELVRGVRPVAKPENLFTVVLVLAEDRYCLGCFRVRTHDVVFGVGYEAAARCRRCGKESGECLTGDQR